MIFYLIVLCKIKNIANTIQRILNKPINSSYNLQHFIMYFLLPAIVRLATRSVNTIVNCRGIEGGQHPRRHRPKNWAQVYGNRQRFGEWKGENSWNGELPENPGIRDLSKQSDCMGPVEQASRNLARNSRRIRPLATIKTSLPYLCCLLKRISKNPPFSSC